MMTSQQQDKLAKAGYIASIVLVAIGVVAAIAPFILPHELHVRLFSPLYNEEYVIQQIPKLAEYTLTDIFHRVGGSAYFILGLFQFNTRFRKRHWKTHRIMGRIWLILTLFIASSIVVWSVTVPFGGFPQAVPALFFGTIFLYSAIQAYLKIRKKDIQAHREWVLRSWNIALGISTIRILFFLFDRIHDFPDRELLGVTFWLSWSSHLILAEWWVQTTRPKSKRVVAVRGA